MGTDKQQTQEEKRDRAARKAPALTETARGTVVKRFQRCGKPNCWCKRPGAQGHGPYHYLMITRGRGKTQTILLAPGQLQKVKRWTKNYRSLKDILEGITQLNVRLIELERNERREKAARRRGRR